MQKYLGKDLDDQFRLYYIDNADHGSEVGTALEGQIVDPGRLPTHIVRYRPVLEQLLRDLSAWVERGVKPPASTPYEVIDGLPVVPANAGIRKGVQPVVDLTVNGGKRAEVKVGKPGTYFPVLHATSQREGDPDTPWARIENLDRVRVVVK